MQRNVDLHRWSFVRPEHVAAWPWLPPPLDDAARERVHGVLVGYPGAEVFQDQFSIGAAAAEGAVRAAVSCTSGGSSYTLDFVATVDGEPRDMRLHGPLEPLLTRLARRWPSVLPDSAGARRVGPDEAQRFVPWRPRQGSREAPAWAKHDADHGGACTRFFARGFAADVAAASDATTEQQAAGALIVRDEAAFRAAVLTALFDERRREARRRHSEEDPLFDLVPDELGRAEDLEWVICLKEVLVLHEALDGLAYIALRFDLGGALDMMPTGLSVVMLGLDAVAIGELDLDVQREAAAHRRVVERARARGSAPPDPAAVAARRGTPLRQVPSWAKHDVGHGGACRRLFDGGLTADVTAAPDATPPMRAAVKLVARDEPSFRAAVLEAVLAVEDRARRTSWNTPHERPLIGLPKIDDPNELEWLVCLRDITVLRADRDGLAYVTLRFDVAWDTEGLALVMHGASRVALGPRDLDTEDAAAADARRQQRATPKTRTAAKPVKAVKRAAAKGRKAPAKARARKR